MTQCSASFTRCTAHAELCPFTKVISQENVYRKVCWGYFLSWDSLCSYHPNLCQGDKKVCQSSALRVNIADKYQQKVIICSLQPPCFPTSTFDGHYLEGILYRIIVEEDWVLALRPWDLSQDPRKVRAWLCMAIDWRCSSESSGEVKLLKDHSPGEGRYSTIYHTLWRIADAFLPSHGLHRGQDLRTIKCKWKNTCRASSGGEDSAVTCHCRWDLSLISQINQSSTSLRVIVAFPHVWEWSRS